nr:hypothetical protein [Rhizobium sp. G21]
MKLPERRGHEHLQANGRGRMAWRRSRPQQGDEGRGYEMLRGHADLVGSPQIADPAHERQRIEKNEIADIEFVGTDPELAPHPVYVEGARQFERLLDPLAPAAFAALDPIQRAIEGRGIRRFGANFSRSGRIQPPQHHEPDEIVDTEMFVIRALRLGKLRRGAEQVPALRPCDHRRLHTMAPGGEDIAPAIGGGLVAGADIGDIRRRHEIHASSPSLIDVEIRCILFEQFSLAMLERMYSLTVCSDKSRMMPISTDVFPSLIQRVTSSSRVVKGSKLRLDAEAWIGACCNCIHANGAPSIFAIQISSFSGGK